jgi:hypothetical protein
MIKNIIVAMALLVLMVIPAELPTIPEVTWRGAYAALLQTYREAYEPYGGILRYIEYDIDLSGTPELIIVGIPHENATAYEAVESVYTFRDGGAVRLELDADVNLMPYFLAARFGITAAPDNNPGLVTYSVGPSAGSFGTNVYYKRLTVEGDRLVVSARGERLVDYDTLHGMFTDFGRGDYDSKILNSAIKEHTHFYLNGERVSEDSLNEVFFSDIELIAIPF